MLDARTPVDLQEWSRAWVDQPGRPTIETQLAISNGKISRLAFRQSDPLGRKLVWPQQLRVTIGNASGRETLNVDLRGAETEVPQAVGMPAPAVSLAQRRRLGLRRLPAGPGVARLPADARSRRLTMR